MTLDIYFAVNRFFCLFLFVKLNRRNSRKDRTVDDRRRFDSRLRSHRQRTKREKHQDRSEGNEKNHQKNAKPRLTQYCDIVGRSDGYMKREYSYVARTAFCFDTGLYIVPYFPPPLWGGGIIKGFEEREGKGRRKKRKLRKIKL